MKYLKRFVEGILEDNIDAILCQLLDIGIQYKYHIYKSIIEIEINYNGKSKEYAVDILEQLSSYLKRIGYSISNSKGLTNGIVYSKNDIGDLYNKQLKELDIDKINKLMNKLKK